MKVIPAHLLMMPCVALMGCTTSHLTPDIQTFGSSVSKIVVADRATPRGKSLSNRVSAARRADFAREGVLYSVNENDEAVCSYNQPALRPESFAEGCALEPIWFDEATGTQKLASSQYDTLAVQNASRHVIRAGDQALLKELLADRLKTDLQNYAEQLKALATATEPTDISVAAGNAFDAFHSLGDEVERAEVATGSARSKRRAANKTLLTTLTREALETWRYNLLKKIVESANDNVVAAAGQLAILSYAHEKTALNKPKTAFENATLDQEPGSAQSLKTVEDAHVALAESDGKAAFRRYANIAQAHTAILQSIKAPADLAQLTAANKRIVALSEAIRAVD